VGEANVIRLNLMIRKYSQSAQAQNDAEKVNFQGMPRVTLHSIIINNPCSDSTPEFCNSQVPQKDAYWDRHNLSITGAGTLLEMKKIFPDLVETGDI